MFSKSSVFSEIVTLIGTITLLAVSIGATIYVNRFGLSVAYIGGWQAPYGITLVIDHFSAFLLLTTSVILISISIYALNYFPKTSQYKRFYIFFFTLTMGINGAFITGDIFNLYVWFEVMLLSSFVLITFGNQKQQLQGGLKYMAMNLVGSLFLLAGIGLIYGKTGTLNIAKLAEIITNYKGEIFWLNTSGILIFMAFGIKAALFPLFYWLPASYHTPNITITSLFAGILTKVGVYALVRFFTLFLAIDQEFWQNLILTIAGLTMLSGGMAASTQYDNRKILSYHIISQIGYMIMGLGIFTTLSITGAIFFIMHNMIAKTNVFLTAGMIDKIKGTYNLKSLGGLYKTNPFLAFLFIIPAFTLAGIPPLSGFFAKFILIKAGFEDGHYITTSVALFTGLLTLYSMIKIWNEAFLKKAPGQVGQNKDFKLTFKDYLPSMMLGSMSILMGIFASEIFDFVHHAAEALMNNANYINSVLK
jgi:multicomponent Na+:H+ antiporter subunit D